jgi:hypothetical protein
MSFVILAEVSDKIATLGGLWLFPAIVLSLAILCARFHRFCLIPFIVFWILIVGLSSYERFIDVNDAFYEAIMNEMGWFYYYSDIFIFTMGLTLMSLIFFRVRKCKVEQSRSLTVKPLNVQQ